MIKAGKENEVFASGAVKSALDADGNIKGRMDLLPWEAIRLLSIHQQHGAEVYPEHSIDLGVPQHLLIDSCIRHLAKYMSGWDDESHLVAACFNCMWALQQTITHPDLIDIPCEAVKKNGRPEK